MTQPFALVLTIALELVMLLPVLAFTGWADHRSMRDRVLLVCAASLITHPFAWFFIVTWTSWQPQVWLRAVPVELAVSLVEGLFYSRLLPVRRTRGLVLGFVANGWSFGLGVLLERMGAL